MEKQGLFSYQVTFSLVSDGSLKLSELPSHSGCTIGSFFTLMYEGLFPSRLYLITAPAFVKIFSATFIGSFSQGHLNRSEFFHSIHKFGVRGF